MKIIFTLALVAAGCTANNPDYDYMSWRWRYEGGAPDLRWPDAARAADFSAPTDQAAPFDQAAPIDFAPCGRAGLRCCAPNACTDGSYCLDGRCVIHCGQHLQAPCEPHGCAFGVYPLTMTCTPNWRSDVVCIEPDPNAPCGTPGRRCCDATGKDIARGSYCYFSAHCDANSGTCKECP